MSESRGLIVVVEDEHAIADLERLYLVDAGFGVHVEREGSAGLAAIRRLRPVAVVLDVGLPGLDGIEVCRALRAADDWTPVIFVTARDDEVDRIIGLELGADDYLTKPFSPRELVVRVKTILRRGSMASGPGTVRVGTVTLHSAERRVEASGRPVPLTSLEFDLLAKLMSAPGQVFTREQLLATVWGQADYGLGRTVDVHVAQLRSKLGDDSPIVTSRGVGYAARDLRSEA
ncbi:response regulator [Lacisediminihabitans changchengi]|uniref:Response regulator n=1 Tax=Lacisediminihabitans changchengi TaxID=2787634 RepID=A0A934SJ30_9MICO|nr:response regulator [Lacisediminihabitans changchengi]MBK4346196.1 response regulator [Lacisediminihabitans changchengi]